MPKSQSKNTHEFKHLFDTPGTSITIRFTRWWWTEFILDTLKQDDPKIRFHKSTTTSGKRERCNPRRVWVLDIVFDTPDILCNGVHWITVTCCVPSPTSLPVPRGRARWKIDYFLYAFLLTRNLFSIPTISITKKKKKCGVVYFILQQMLFLFQLYLQALKETQDYSKVYKPLSEDCIYILISFD